MFSPQLSSRAGSPNPFANTYRQVGNQTAVAAATPHRLIEMLFEGCMDALAQAKGALRSGQVDVKGRALGRAVRIVDEGLRAALDLRDGGPLAADLHALYGYLTMRLTAANLRNDEAAIEECQRLLSPLREAWQAIGPQVNAAKR
ncbi:MAG: flagellar export chaperone FliS [Rubrivivax sp.]|nr:flagellar export chaperone FliS [Rubrivivax sp.]